MDARDQPGRLVCQSPFLRLSLPSDGVVVRERSHFDYLAVLHPPPLYPGVADIDYDVRAHGNASPVRIDFSVANSVTGFGARDSRRFASAISRTTSPTMFDNP